MELPEVNPSGSKPAGKRWLWPVISVLVLVVGGLFLFKTLHNISFSSSKPQADINYSPYVDFAENFVVAFNNISYENQDQQRAVLAEMMQSDLLTSYQNAFYDQQFLKMISDYKIYINFQKLTRSEVVSTAVDQAAIKVIGFDGFHSNVTGSQKEKPFTYLVDVVKVGTNKYQVTKVAKL